MLGFATKKEMEQLVSKEAFNQSVKEAAFLFAELNKKIDFLFDSGKKLAEQNLNILKSLMELEQQKNPEFVFIGSCDYCGKVIRGVEQDKFTFKKVDVLKGKEVFVCLDCKDKPLSNCTKCGIMISDESEMKDLSHPIFFFLKDSHDLVCKRCIIKEKIMPEKYYNYRTYKEGDVSDISSFDGKTTYNNFYTAPLGESKRT